MFHNLKFFLIALLGGMPLFAQYSFDFVCLDDTIKFITDTTTYVQFDFRLENTGTLPDSYALNCRVIDSVPGWEEIFCAAGVCAFPGQILYDYLEPGEVDDTIYIAVVPDSHYGTEVIELAVSSVRSPGLSEAINVYVVKEVGITEDNEGLSVNTTDLQVHPNPFGRKTNIKYSIGYNNGVDSRQKSVVSMKIYDASGRSVKSFLLPTFNLSLPTSVAWDGTDDRGLAVPAGIYFIQLDQNGFKKTATIIRLK